MKRLFNKAALTIFIVIAMCMALVPASFATQSEPQLNARSKTFAPITKDAGATAAQLVIVVEFSNSPQTSGYDAKTSSSYGTMWNYFKSTIDDTATVANTSPSFRSFIKLISNGKHDVKSYFPQSYDDSTFMHIRVDMTAESYMTNRSDDALIAYALNQLNQRTDIDPSVFDVDKDGFIDNVLLVPELRGFDPNDSFASHQGSIASTKGIYLGTGSNRKQVGKYTVVKGGCSDYFDSFSPSVAVHEYLHTLNARDYYRNSSSGAVGDPVENWDIMAKGGTFAWPLAFTRQTAGWVSIDSIDLDNLQPSYTLYSPESGKTQALIIPSKNSSSEFFVVEYRKRNTDRSKGDFYIGSSGLIVYRVNNAYAFEGNTKGKDYVYVFRPNETSLTASQGDISRAAICASNYATQNNYRGSISLDSSIGTLDMTKGITDGAIVYADGTNSGLLIEATNQTDDSITFTVASAADPEGLLWSTVKSIDGTLPFGTLYSPATSTATNGTDLFVINEDKSSSNAKVAVYKYSDQNWSQLGKTLTDIQYAKLACFNNELYVLGSVKNQKKIRLKKFSNGSWSDVTTTDLDGMCYFPALTAVGNKLYAFVDSYDPATYTSDHFVYELNGNELKRCGDYPIPLGNTSHPTFTLIGNKPAVIAEDSSSRPWSTKVFTYSNGFWSEQDPVVPNAAASSISATVFNGKTYVYTGVSNSGAHVYVYSEDGVLEKDEDLSSVLPDAESGYLKAGVKNVYLITVRNDRTATGVVSAYSFDGGDTSKLAQVGTTVYSGSTDVDVSIISDRIYVALADGASQLVTVRAHELPANDVPLPAPVPAIDIATTTLEFADCEYDPAGTKPTVKVWLDEGTLLSPYDQASGTGDYTLSLSNIDKAGTATCTITGKGRFTGTKTESFAITAKKLDKAQMGSIADQTYSGQKIEPAFTITLDGHKLTANKDYTFVYGNNTNAGKGTITITGIGNYTGTRSFEFTIAAKSISHAKVTAIGEQTFTGKAIEPSVEVKLDNRTLTLNTDYTVAYDSNTNVGTANVTITGKGNYAGSIFESFKIVKEDAHEDPSTPGTTTDPQDPGTADPADPANPVDPAEPIDISGLIITVEPCVFDPKGVSPKVTVWLDGDTVLSPYDAATGKGDYALSFANIDKPGKATCTITGKGDYTGTKTISFTISAMDISKAKIASIADQTYTGSKIEPMIEVTIDGRKLVLNTDYTVAYTNNIDAGTANVTITGLGNYTGTSSDVFRIVKQEKPDDLEIPDPPLEPTYPEDPNDPGTDDPGTIDPVDPADPGASDPTKPEDPGSTDPSDPKDPSTTDSAKPSDPGSSDQTDPSVSDDPIDDPQPNDLPGTWVHDGHGWWFSYDESTSSHINKRYPANEKVVLGDKTYYFDAYGYLQTGWRYIGRDWYFFEDSGAMKTGWHWDGAWYLLDETSGAMKTGWFKDAVGTWYYMDQSGAMRTGWLWDGAWYYLQGSGAMATGWFNDRGTWYLLNEKSGFMHTGWVKDKTGTWYYLEDSGAMRTGWLYYRNAWYYLHGSGAMAKNEWVGNYWLQPSGIMATNLWVDNGKYHVGPDGVWDDTQKSTE